MFIGKTDIKKPVALALGTFDGLHKGHRSVIDLAVNNPFGLAAAVSSFSPNPKAALTGRETEMIITPEKRHELLLQMGVKHELCFNFNRIRNMEPETFIKLLTDALPVKMICCGYNFRFGRNGSGDVETLKKMCYKYNIEFACAAPVTVNGEHVSSSAIREYIAEGDIFSAENFLGREMVFSLPVISGDQRGRTIGFPTINQALPERLVHPKFGVYASSVTVGDRVYPGVTNIGIRPTFRLERPLFETFIVGYDGNLYDKIIDLRLRKFIRSEVKFTSLEQLKSQIESDLSTAISLNEKSEG